MLLYAEVPDFYAQLERRAHPALRERPVIVGGDPRKRGLVQSATPDARAAGVEVGMTVLEALERCPRARALRTDMRSYREASAALRACLRREAMRMEPAGLEAAYLDVGGSGEEPEVIGLRLRERVAEDLGLPLRVGAAPIKFLAKIAAEHAGEEGFFRVTPSRVQAFLDPQPVSVLPGVGPRTEARLAELGARTVGEVRSLAAGLLEERLGNHGLAILEYARGRDRAGVRAARGPRTVSQELTLRDDEVDRGVLEERLAELAGGLAVALARERLAARRVVLKVRYGDQETTTRSRTVVQAVALAPELLALATELLARTQAGVRPIRGLGVAASGLVRSRRDDRQLDLFGRG